MKQPAFQSFLDSQRFYLVYPYRKRPEKGYKPAFLTFSGKISGLFWKGSSIGFRVSFYFETHAAGISKGGNQSMILCFFSRKL
jgi:hypothetical protein